MDKIIVCPACHAKNKIPSEKSGIKAKCGKCGAELPEKSPADGSERPLILRCTQCGGKNRVPVEKLPQGAKCGKCHTPLKTEDVMTAWAIPVTDINFDSKVLQSPLPVLLELISPTCGACTISRPVVNQLAADWKGRVRVGRMDIIQSPHTANRYQVMSTPTSLIFDRKRLVDTVIGAVPREVFLRKLAPYLA